MQGSRGVARHGLFAQPSLPEMWTDIDQVYKQMGFTDAMSDSERISEYKYIRDNFCKIVGTWESRAMLPNGEIDFSSLLEQIRQSVSEPPPSFERRGLVFATVKSGWLSYLEAVCQTMMDDEPGFGQNEDEDDYS